MLRIQVFCNFFPSGGEQAASLQEARPLPGQRPQLGPPCPWDRFQAGPLCVSPNQGPDFLIRNGNRLIPWITGFAAPSGKLLEQLAPPPLHTFFLLFDHTTQHVGSQFPIPGVNPHSLQWTCSLNHWTTREPPCLCLFDVINRSQIKSNWIPNTDPNTAHVVG